MVVVLRTGLRLRAALAPKLLMLAHLGFQRITQGGTTMLKTFAVVLLATAMSVGLAQAKGHMQKQMPVCAEGQQAATTCTCGPAKTVCKKGQ